MMIFWVKLSCLLSELCLPGDMKNGHAGEVIPSANKWPFQDHLSSKSIVLMSSISYKT